MASPDWPIDEAPGRDVRAPISETFRLESGQRLAATAVTGRLYGPRQGPLVIVAGGVSLAAADAQLAASDALVTTYQIALFKALAGGWSEG